MSLTSSGRPAAASVDVAIGMLDMPMTTADLPLRAEGVGRFTASFSGLSMAGRWGLVFTVTPRSGTGAFPIVVEDQLELISRAPRYEWLCPGEPRTHGRKPWPERA